MYNKTIFLLVNDATLPSDNPLRILKHILKRIYNNQSN